MDSHLSVPAPHTDIPSFPNISSHTPTLDPNSSSTHATNGLQGPAYLPNNFSSTTAPVTGLIENSAKTSQSTTSDVKGVFPLIHRDGSTAVVSLPGYDDNWYLREKNMILMSPLMLL